MGLFDRHIDRLLADFSGGGLSPAKTRRMMDHAKGCERCGALLNEVLAAQRVLQGSLFKPAEQEQAAWSAGAAAVVAASAARPEKSSNRAWFLAFAAATAACLALFFLWPRAGVVGRDDEFGVRGDGKTAQVSLRVFCVSEAAGLVELSPSPGPAACPVGASLGFAAGANEPLKQLRLKVTQDGKALAAADFPVAGKPGSTEAVDLSVALGQPGKVLVEVSFAETVEGLAAAKWKLEREVAVGAK